MKKPRLILHIGSHKTGTTSIQRYCREHQEVLFQLGIFYPSYDLIGEKEHYAHHALAHGISGTDERWPLEKVRRFLTLVAESCPAEGTILISAEPFYRHLILDGEAKSRHLPDREYWQAKRRYIDTVAEVFQDFDVEIVAVFRNQINYFNSLYQEMIKVTRFSGTPFELYLMKRNEFNYYGQMKTWSSCFPNVRVLVFEDLVRSGELVHGFLKSVVGRDLQLPEATAWVNSSFHPMIIETKRRFNTLPESQVGEDGRLAVGRSAMEKLQKFAFAKRVIEPVRHHNYLTPGECRFFSLSCRAANRTLRRTYFPDGGKHLEHHDPEVVVIDTNDAGSQKVISRLLQRLLKLMNR